MKKGIFLFVILSGMAWQSNAQEKNRFWIGGSFGLQSEESTTQMQGASISYTDHEIHGHSIFPELGYIFSDRWAAGVRLGISKSDEVNRFPSNTAEEYRKTTSNAFSIAPFLRYTCLNRKAFSVYIDGGIYHSQSKHELTDIHTRYYYNGSVSDTSTTVTTSKDNAYGIYVNPGCSLRLSDCISLTGTVRFFDASYGKKKGVTDYNYEFTNNYGTGSQSRSWSDSKKYSVDLNSPFSLSSYSIGFSFSF
jgi:hypothetical protein